MTAPREPRSSRAPSPFPAHGLALSSTRLWLGVLAAPVAWVVNELVGYPVVGGRCEAGRVGVFSTGSGAASVGGVAVSLVMIIVAVVGLVIAFQNWRAVTSGRGSNGIVSASGRTSRVYFFGVAGLFVSILFGCGVLLFAISPLVVSCTRIR